MSHRRAYTASIHRFRVGDHGAIDMGFPPALRHGSVAKRPHRQPPGQDCSRPRHPGPMDLDAALTSPGTTAGACSPRRRNGRPQLSNIGYATTTPGSSASAHRHQSRRNIQRIPGCRCTSPEVSSPTWCSRPTAAQPGHRTHDAVGQELADQMPLSGSSGLNEYFAAWSPTSARCCVSARPRLRHDRLIRPLRPRPRGGGLTRRGSGSTHPKVPPTVADARRDKSSRSGLDSAPGGVPDANHRTACGQCSSVEARSTTRDPALSTPQRAIGCSGQRRGGAWASSAAARARCRGRQ
jgi:hypothetical protein